MEKKSYISNPSLEDFKQDHGFKNLTLGYR